MWVDTPPPGGNSQLDDSGDYGGMMMQDLGPPHVSLAALLVILLALKVFTESNLISAEPAELKVSTLNIVNVGVQAVTFIIFLKLFAAWLLNRGYIVPGFNELVGAI